MDVNNNLSHVFSHLRKEAELLFTRLEEIIYF